MRPFEEKAIFLWCYWDISEDPVVVADRLVEGGFEAVYVHTNDGFFEGSYARLENGKYVTHLNCTPALVAEIRRRGIKIYGWGAPYGVNTAAEIAMMVSQTKRYGLAGYIIDAEGTWDAQGDVISDTRKIISEYKAQCPGVPVAWCWWPLWHVPGGTGLYHLAAILKEAMLHADYGMPMAYWNWQNDALGIRFLGETVRQWREVTDKPLTVAGRAYVDAYGEPTREAVEAFDRLARDLGSVGISWWDLQHAVKLPECWQALKETKKFGTEEPMADWTKCAIGLYTKTATWTNAAFDFIIGHAGESWNEPNAQLKPIEAHAAELKQVFGVLWDFDVDFYSYNQYQGDDAHWPPAANDAPLQMAIRALTSRNPAFVVVRVMTEKSAYSGKVEDPAYISYAAKVFMGRLGDWLRANKPKAKLVLGTNNDFITKFAPNINNWGYQYPTMIHQKAVLPLVINAYPQADDKVKNFISTRPTNEFWWYYDTDAADLVLFTGGDEAAWRAWVGVDAAQDTTPPSVPAGLTGKDAGLGVVLLTWSASTDNVGVTGYQVYRNGVKIATSIGTAASIANQLPGTYTYGVAAYDAAGNESAPATISVTVKEAEPEVTRAEFVALAARVAALEKSAHPKAHTHTTGEPV